MKTGPIIPNNSSPPLAPYSPGFVAGNILYVGGTLALDAEGKTVAPGDVRAQTKFVLDTVEAVIKEAGGTLKDIAFNQIFISNLADYAAMNEVYKMYFPVNPPARYCIRADLVRPDFLVEIASTVHLGSSVMGGK